MGKEDPTETERLLAGGITGAVVRTIVQPLDVLKIRFQLQHEPINRTSKVSKYRSLPQSVIDIVKEEGIRSLWKGHVPAQLLSITYTAVQFSSFNMFEKLIDQSINPNGESTSPKGQRINPNSESINSNSESIRPKSESIKKPVKSQPLNYLISGSLAGMTAAFVSHPFDTVRTRLVGQGEPKVYKSMTAAFSSMVRKEGMTSLFRGLKPNLILVVPQSGSTFMSYKLFKDFWSRTFDEKSAKSTNDTRMADRGNGREWMKNLVCGASSGIVSKTIVYPFDSMKKRLQVQGFEEARSQFGRVERYSSTLHCFSRIRRQESLLGLYKGYLPTLIKATLSTAINFALFEYLVGF